MKNFFIILIIFSLNICYAFFPKGIYTGNYTTFKELKNSGFNILVGPSTDTDLIYAKKYDLKLIPSLYFNNKKSIERTKQIKNDTSIFAWYIFDEPDLYNCDTLTYKKYRNELKKIDNNKPLYLTIWDPSKYKDYINYCDIFAIDPYPIKFRQDKFNDLSLVYKQTRYAKYLCDKYNKPLYAIIQCFFQVPWWKRAPTALELHNMVYQALIGGSQGIFYYIYSTNTKKKEQFNIYNYPLLIKELKKINQELDVLENIVLSKEKSDINIIKATQSQIVFSFKKYKNKYYLISANPSLSQEKLEIYFNQNIFKIKQVFTSENSNINFNKNKIKILLSKYGYNITEINF